jgi:hypothetical protein
MADDPSWKHLQNLGLDPAAVRWAVTFSVGWFVAWTGFGLYSGNELVPTLMQGAAFAVALGVIAYLTKARSRS